MRGRDHEEGQQDSDRDDVIINIVKETWARADLE